MDNTTKPVPVVAEYFECPEGSPSVLSLLLALEGVTGALDQEQITVGDHEQIHRVSCLGTAAYILASQLQGRCYGSKPPSKRQLEKARKAREEWIATSDAMREKLAGPAQEYLRAAKAIQQEGNA